MPWYQCAHSSPCFSKNTKLQPSCCSWVSPTKLGKGSVTFFFKTFFFLTLKIDRLVLFCFFMFMQHFLTFQSRNMWIVFSKGEKCIETLDSATQEKCIETLDCLEITNKLHTFLDLQHLICCYRSRNFRNAPLHEVKKVTSIDLNLLLPYCPFYFFVGVCFVRHIQMFFF